MCKSTVFEVSVIVSFIMFETFKKFCDCEIYCNPDFLKLDLENEIFKPCDPFL